MGEYKAQPDPEIVRLQRESQEMLAALKAKLNELDDARTRSKARHATPEQRRRAFRVIEGGAVAIVAALIWAWETARRPAVAVAAGSTVVATGAFVTAPMVHPGTAQGLPEFVVTSESVEPQPSVIVEQGDELSGATSGSPTPSEPSPERASSPAKPQSTPAPKPTATATATSSPSPTPKPSPTPTAKVTADVEVDLGELDAEAQLCLDVGLPPLADVGACLERAEKLGLDVDLGLGLLGN